MVSPHDFDRAPRSGDAPRQPNFSVTAAADARDDFMIWDRRRGPRRNILAAARPCGVEHLLNPCSQRVGIHRGFRPRILTAFLLQARIKPSYFRATVRR